MIVETIIIGAGITGLSLASYIKNNNYLIIEKSDIIGGYCKTKIVGDFVWDYSGHFFHFSNEEIKNKLVKNLDCEILEIKKISKIYYNGKYIDFPFQNNIHQLDKSEFIDCLIDIYNCVDYTSSDSFIDNIYKKLGKSICDKFIIPYNKKLYSCDLNDLDYNCMGRFFPKIKFDDIMRSINGSKYISYNDTFIYPVKGAFEFVRSICKDVNINNLRLNEKILSINLDKKIIKTNVNEYKFSKLISTIPFDNLLELSNNENKNLNKNKVVVFNIGFDRPATTNAHWIYYPGSEIFYRVGFYSNILSKDRMSIYVEIGMGSEEDVVEKIILSKVLTDLKSVGIITNHQVVDYQMIILDPAYVYITKESIEKYKNWSKKYNKENVYSIGRYGSWTYCSIEDNILEAKKISELL